MTPGDHVRAEGEGVGGSRIDTGGKLAVKPRRLPPNDHGEPNAAPRACR